MTQCLKTNAVPTAQIFEMNKSSRLPGNGNDLKDRRTAGGRAKKELFFKLKEGDCFSWLSTGG